MPLLSARYAQWTCSCGTLLYMMGFMGRVPFRDRYRAIAFQVAMIVSGFLGTYLWNPWNRYMFVISMVTWVFVIMYINRFLSDAQRFCLHTDDIPRLKVIRIYSVIVWTLFPVFWCLGEFGLIRPLSAELLTACVDIGAKIIYSATLHWTNLMSFERFEMLRAISKATDFSDAEQASKAKERIDSLQRMVSMVASVPRDEPPAKLSPVNTAAASNTVTGSNSNEATPFVSLAGGSHRLSAFQCRFLERIKAEFKEPLNSVIQLSASVLSTQVDEQHREQLHITLSSAQTLLTNIDNMLALSEAEQHTASGTPLVSEQPFRLHAMLDALTDFGAQRIGDKLQNIELLVSFDPRSPTALAADFRRIFLVLRNLLDNSIKYTTRGVVFVHATVVSATDADPTCEASGNKHVLQVICQDSGDATLFPHEAFGVVVPADRRYLRRDRQSGVGLGLMVVRSLISAMGGTLSILPPVVSATSTSGENCDGTTITIRVPVRCLSAAEATQAGFRAEADSTTGIGASAAATEAAAAALVPVPSSALHMPAATPLLMPASGAGLRQRLRGGPSKHAQSSDDSPDASSELPSLRPLRVRLATPELPTAAVQPPRTDVLVAPLTDRNLSAHTRASGGEPRETSAAHAFSHPLIDVTSPKSSPTGQSPHSSEVSPPSSPPTGAREDASPASSNSTASSSVASNGATGGASSTDGMRPLSAVICIELPLLRDVLSAFVALTGAHVRVVHTAAEVAHAVLQSVDVLIIDAELLSASLELSSLLPASLRAPCTLIEVQSMLSSADSALLSDALTVPALPSLGSRVGSGGEFSVSPAPSPSARRKSPQPSTPGSNRGGVGGGGAVAKGGKMTLAGAMRVPVFGVNAQLLRHFVFARPIKMSSLLVVLRAFVDDANKRHAFKQAATPAPATISISTSATAAAATTAQSDQGRVATSASR